MQLFKKRAESCVVSDAKVSFKQSITSYHTSDHITHHM